MRTPPALPAPGRRGLLAGLAGLSAASLLPGCSFPARLDPVPRDRTFTATALGIRNERWRLGTPTGAAIFEEEGIAAIARQRARLGLASSQMLPRLDLLAVSGGGENGAYGAGLLNGWTLQGTRPTFDLVTGVSTGALTAPFAFLGPDWDEKLKRVYTDITLADVIRSRWLTAAIFDDGMADTTPLFATISRQFDEAMLAAIARGYDDGRLLLVGTTDLDAQMPVVWNIGAIAKSGHPRALDTVRRVLLASAAIPGAFPPVMIDVEVDGRPHQEMHVDGGAFAQAFLYPPAVTRVRREAIRARRPVPPATAWVIRNGRLDPEWASVDRRTMSIAGRAVSTMIAASGFNDVLRMYNNARADEIAFRLAYIDRSFTMELASPFEPTYMRALYDHGFARARAGHPWDTAPPA
jgi:hypothetical protein